MTTFFQQSVRYYLSRLFYMTVLLLAAPLSLLPAYANDSLWQDISQPLLTAQSNHQSSNQLKKIRQASYQDARWLKLNSPNMLARLTGDSASITVPLPSGENITLQLEPTQLLATALSQKFPQIKTYRVLPDARIFSGRVDISAQGFHASLQTREGKNVFIDPVVNSVDSMEGEYPLMSRYVSFNQHVQSQTPFACGALRQGPDPLLSSKRLPKYALSKRSSITSLVTYRIAIAATGEYTAKHGGTVASALSAITTTLSRVNQIFEQDLGIRLVLVENNDQLIYTDAASDPYSAKDNEALLQQNQNNIEALIGANHYDLGHLFTTRGGGLAAIASVCDNTHKAKGLSGTNHPLTDSFDLDFVAHEIAHQFGATHTFNSNQGLCAGDTRSARTAFEPGSGSSIMSYAGYCGQDNLQGHTDAMFHIGSIEQVKNYIQREAGSRCGVVNEQINSAPIVNAGEDYFIPAKTPFELKGSAQDADGDELVYAWEQLDVGEKSAENQDRGNNALFRIHLPSSSARRSFPPLIDMLAHYTPRGEHLPVRQRPLTFRLVAQDGKQTQSDEMKVQVLRTGSRFALNLPRAEYHLGESHEVFWNVAKTNQAPINCDSVNIYLSLDGGYHFPRVLGENLANTGSAWITIPADIAATNRARFKIKCTNNIFFALSYRNFSLTNNSELGRFILNDENQPETNLLDKILNEDEAVTMAAPSSSSSSKAAGGSLNGAFLLLLLWLLFRPFVLKGKEERVKKRAEK